MSRGLLWIFLLGFGCFGGCTPAADLGGLGVAIDPIEPQPGEALVATPLTPSHWEEDVVLQFRWQIGYFDEELGENVREDTAFEGDNVPRDTTLEGEWWSVTVTGLTQSGAAVLAASSQVHVR